MMGWEIQAKDFCEDTLLTDWSDPDGVATGLTA
jgi:hypothetical protein